MTQDPSTNTTPLSQIENDVSKDFYKLMEDDDCPLLNNCCYREPNDVDHLENGSAKLKVLFLNIRSLPDKIDQLQDLLNILKDKNYEMDLILLCETFINDKNVDRCKLANYTFEEVHRTKKVGGGVGIFVNSKLKYKVRNDLIVFDEGIFESIFIELYSKNKNIITGSIYRVPNTNEKQFIDKYSNIIEKINTENKDIIIGTDQNLDYLKCDRHTNTANFLNFNLESGLLPLVTKPSRITHSTATLIDNIYVKSRNVPKSKTILLVTDISDHLPCLVLIDCEYHTKKQPLEFEHRKLNDQALENIKLYLEDNDWRQLEDMDPNEGYNLLTSTISDALDIYAPLKMITIPAKYVITEPWMTKGLMKSSRTCDKMYSKVIGLSKDLERYIRYKKYRNTYNSLKRKAKIAYYQEKIEQFYNNSRQLWKTLNVLIGKQSDKSSLPDAFDLDGNLISDPTQISNEFCSYFSTVGSKLASKIPNSNKNPETYLTGNYLNSFYMSPTDEAEVMQIILSLKSKRSCGKDGISNVFLKSISEQILKPLTKIINKSIETGIVPEGMKLAKIVPSYKSKEPTLFSNYRPISLLPAISKVFEKVIYKRLYNYVSVNNILYKSQYGFRSGHSTTYAVSEFVTDVLKGFDNKEMTLAVFLDLSKAFDTVDHSILLMKLEHYGVRGIPLLWFKNYLAERKQFVQYQKYESQLQEIKYGVPQGSVLGPLLFLIYINDLKSCLSICKAIIFADDTTIYITGKNKKDLIFELTNDLACLKEWFDTSKLSLNISKTNYMMFHPKRVRIETVDDDYVLLIGNEAINEVHSVKFLGLHLDKHLEWTEHFKVLHRKLGRANYLLNSVKNIIPKRIMRTLYHSLFYSHLMYGLFLWGPSMLSCNKNKLFKAQKKAIRIISGAQYNANTDALFVDLNLLKLADMVDLEMLKLMYLFSKNALPQNMVSVFTVNRLTHNYNTRFRNDPQIMQRNYSILDRSFLCRAPAMWANLPLDIRSCPTISSFKRNVKKLKLRLY